MTTRTAVIRQPGWYVMGLARVHAFCSDVGRGRRPSGAGMTRRRTSAPRVRWPSRQPTAAAADGACMLALRRPSDGVRPPARPEPGPAWRSLAGDHRLEPHVRRLASSLRQRSGNHQTISTTPILPFSTVEFSLIAGGKGIALDRRGEFIDFAATQFGAPGLRPPVALRTGWCQ